MTVIQRDEAGRVTPPLNEQVEPADGESVEDWSDRLLQLAREARTYRQCTLGWHLECSDPEGEECRCGCHPWPAEAIEAPMEMGVRVTRWYWEQGRGWVLEPEVVAVPRDALKALVEQADVWRSRADSQFVCTTPEQEASDTEFASLVEALGVDGLMDEEED